MNTVLGLYYSDLLILLAQHGVIYLIRCKICIIIIFGHTVLGVLDSDLNSIQILYFDFGFILHVGILD